ncbi:uncharacterized protein N7459_008833 [Penicillium hispanicum]|uniref:uncharacterized protein n=1 Tax=Penicillium hispanicum TaxID=1080232 RepID=UPI00254060D1|nr:uncharacterized protein N7459_008833 [Penicillium hispanicum]KAJ5574406.1 hypothetical protein N7459_008833 [Penicillium hispanicum]
MSDNNHHPGVRSLLAKFENSQSPVASPPSRGRSPAPSDTPSSTRPLSRVRASFVTVEGAIQSNPGSPLRKTSGRSDSPGMFGPKINEQEVETRRQNVVSPTPAGAGENGQVSLMDQVTSEPRPEAASAFTAAQGNSKEEPAASVNKTATPNESAPVKEQPAISAPAVGRATPSEKAAPKTVTKRPSNIHAAKTNAASKSASTATASTTTKSSTNNTTAKPPSAREVAKERANALAHKPSRVSLNSAPKSTARTVRGSTPSHESSRTSPTSLSGAKSRTKSPTKPVRLPASMTAPTQASAAKLGSNGSSAGRTSTTPSTLTRKPSSLKSATGAPSTRSTAGPTASVRRQSSRPSLPTQPAHDRPSSRASDVGSKPVNEGFLARMMRPTASSASKTHDRPEAKAPPKTSAAPKASRPSMGRVPERAAVQPKGNAAVLRPQTEKSQIPNKEPTPQEEVKLSRQEQGSEKENIEDGALAIPEHSPAMESNDTIIEEPETEISTKSVPEPAEEKRSEENQTDDTNVELVKPEPTVESAAEPVTKAVEPSILEASTETSAEASTEAVTEGIPEARTHADDTVDAPKVPAETKDEASEQKSEIPDVKDAELSAEVNVKANGVEAPEVQPELSTQEVVEVPAPSATAIEAAPVHFKASSQAQPETPEVTRSTETFAEEPKQDSSETVKDDTATEMPSKSTDEPTSKETDAEEQQTGESKPITDDVDFASLTLN